MHLNFELVAFKTEGTSGIKNMAVNVTILCNKCIEQNEHDISIGGSALASVAKKPSNFDLGDKFKNMEIEKHFGSKSRWSWEDNLWKRGKLYAAVVAAEKPLRDR